MKSKIALIFFICAAFLTTFPNAIWRSNPTSKVPREAPLRQARISIETNKSIFVDMVKNSELPKWTSLREAFLFVAFLLLKFSIKNTLSEKL